MSKGQETGDFVKAAETSCVTAEDAGDVAYASYHALMAIYWVLRAILAQLAKRGPR